MNRGDFLRIMAAGLAGAGFSDSLLAASKSSASPAKTKVELGIDVLESMGFSPISGMRIGLLTHPAGVNRNGCSSIDVLRSARNKGGTWNTIRYAERKGRKTEILLLSDIMDSI